MNDLTGKKFGRLLVLCREKRTDRGAVWKCVCDCGKEITTREYSLLSGHTKSCGCRRKEFGIKHGYSSDIFYRYWRCMMSRCYKTNNASYPFYGGRGIYVCDDWHEFKKFRAWAEASNYADGKTLDRVDVEKGYSPENCRWATKKEQARNRRNNVMYKGKSLAEWAENVGLPYWKVYNRIRNNGWPIEEALGIAPHVRKRKRVIQDE